MCVAHGNALAQALMQPACYPHPVARVERLETHISWVFLTGMYAYKVKKPVDFGFLDCSTLEARRKYCEDEVRLNRRLASQIYLDVVPICGSCESPHVDGNGPPIEHALRMREFPQNALASVLLGRDALTPALVADLAGRIAAFHAGLPAAPAASPYGTPEGILRDAEDNFSAIRAMPRALVDEDDFDQLDALQAWTRREYDTVYPSMLERHGTAVKECHGDLHLANIALLDGKLVPFDCLEFNAALRWIDVMNEVAFTVMDLFDRGADALAWLFLNAYLEASGDYSGVAVLRFYLVYRAMVRAKVHLLRALQSSEETERRRLRREYRAYVSLATRCSRIGRPAIVLMHGYSGCGKTSVAREIVRAVGGIVVRSDVERRRLHGLAALQPSGSPPGGGIYAPSASDVVYARLCACASAIAHAGYTALVDATFLRRSERARFRAAARTLGVPVIVVDVQAPADVLNARIALRQAYADDASEATALVLQRQIAASEPLEVEEDLQVVRVDGCRHLGLLAAAELLGHLSGARA